MVRRPEEKWHSEGNAYLSLKRTCEQDLKAKILDALGYIPNVTVGVNVELENKLPPVIKNAPQTAAPTNSRPENAISALSNNPENLTGPSDTALQQPNVAKVIDSILGDSRGKNNVFPPRPAEAPPGSKPNRRLFPWRPRLGCRCSCRPAISSRFGKEIIPSSPAMPRRRPLRPRSTRFASRNRPTSSVASRRCFLRQKTQPMRRIWSR